MTRARDRASGGNSGSTANRPATASVGSTYYDTTLDNFFVYKPSGWSAVSPVPEAPTGVSAVAVSGTSATVSFTPASTGPVPTSYTITSSPGGVTANGASSPVTVTGLSAATAYTFTIQAIGANGSSAASAASSAVTTAKGTGGTITTSGGYW